MCIRDSYKDKHGQTIYYNKRTRVGYVVPEKDFSKFQILQMRYILALVIAVLLYSMTNISYWPVSYTHLVL